MAKKKSSKASSSGKSHLKSQILQESTDCFDLENVLRIESESVFASEVPKVSLAFQENQPLDSSNPAVISCLPSSAEVKNRPQSPLVEQSDGKPTVSSWASLFKDNRSRTSGGDLHFVPPADAFDWRWAI